MDDVEKAFSLTEGIEYPLDIARLLWHLSAPSRQKPMNTSRISCKKQILELAGFVLRLKDLD
jgi:hypothetical protein